MQDKTQSTGNNGKPHHLLPPPPTREKFGKVFVTKKNDKPKGLFCLEGVRFSNVDLKWYTNDGEVHPAYEQHRDQPFHFRFTFWNKDYCNGVEEVEFTGTLLPCFPLGGGVPPLKMAELEEAETSAAEWVTSLGLLSSNGADVKEMARFKYACTGSFATVITPGFSAQQRKLILMFISTFYVFDDLLLELGSNSFAKLQEITTLIGDVMKGKKKIGWEDKIGKVPSNLRLRSFLAATQLMREEALKTVSEEEAAPMFEAYAEHVSSYAVENCVEWKELEAADPKSFRNGQANLRCLTAGSRFALELIMVSRGIVIEPCVRQSFVFKHFVALCERQGSLVNDLMSFRKELKDGENCNFTYLLHVVDGLPLDSALERTFDQINSLTGQIIKLGEMLSRSLFPDKPEVGRFVEVAKGIVQGHYLYFPFASRRYAHDFAYDCVVDDVERFDIKLD